MRYVAFLRAINVGGHVVKMSALVSIFESLGFSDVRTFIASGNVAFSTRSTPAATPERKLEAALAHELGYDVATFIRTPAELALVAAQSPNAGPDDGLYVGFLKAPASANAKSSVAALAGPEDSLELRGRELYWRRAGRFSDSRITGAKLERALGSPTTIRNVTTLRKIAAALTDDG